MRLNLGCGTTKKLGFVGVDRLKLDTVDVVHNLDQFPYPFADNSVQEIWMDQVLEHLQEPVRVIQELYRICADGARITVGVPYFRSRFAIIDPTHRNFFGVQWFDYFDPKRPFYERYRYFDSNINIERVEFNREAREAGTLTWFARSLVALAEKYPISYEARLSHLLPLDSLTFHLQVKK